jgi:hypothetical protein
VSALVCRSCWLPSEQLDEDGLCPMPACQSPRGRELAGRLDRIDNLNPQSNESEKPMAKRKQMQIPGTERPSFPKVDVAAEQYEKARDSRMKKSEAEHDAKLALIEAMKKHKLSVYRDDNATPPIVVTLADGDPKVKVTRADLEIPEGAGDEDEAA